MTFHSEKAMELMKAISTMARKGGYDYDEYSDRHAKKYIKNKGLSMFDRKYHITTLHVEASRYQDALDVLENIETMISKDDERALHTYQTGLCSLRLGKVEEARKAFKVKENEPHTEQKIFRSFHLTLPFCRKFYITRRPFRRRFNTSFPTVC